MVSIWRSSLHRVWLLAALLLPLGAQAQGAPSPAPAIQPSPILIELSASLGASIVFSHLRTQSVPWERQEGEVARVERQYGGSVAGHFGVFVGWRAQRMLHLGGYGAFGGVSEAWPKPQRDTSAFMWLVGPALRIVPGGDRGFALQVRGLVGRAISAGLALGAGLDLGYVFRLRSMLVTLAVDLHAIRTRTSYSGDFSTTTETRWYANPGLIVKLGF